MKFKKIKNILILQNGSIVINFNQIFLNSESFLFSEKDSSNCFLNKRNNESFFKISESDTNYKKKYLNY